MDCQLELMISKKYCQLKPKILEKIAIYSKVSQLELCVAWAPKKATEIYLGQFKMLSKCTSRNHDLIMPIEMHCKNTACQKWH